MFINVLTQLISSIDILEGVILFASLLFLSLYMYNLSTKYFLVVGSMLAVLGMTLVISTVTEYLLATACMITIIYMMIVSIDYFLMIAITKRRWLNHVPYSVSVNIYSSLLGKSGYAETDIGKRGKVNIEGAIYQAHSDTPIKLGSRVRVSSVEGKVLNVQLDI